MAKSEVRRNSTNSPQLVRLNKFIADAGICSRRKADELIESGQITLNGKRVFEHGVKVDPDSDKVLVKGKPILTKAELVYYVVHKPQNVVTTMDDPIGRPTIADLIKSKKRIFPVGRLDWDTEGLLLMTNDGKFAQNVAHPTKEISKTYLAKINGKLEPQHVKRLLNGVTIVGGKVSAKQVERARKGTSGKYEWIKIVITEGKNRQVRKMFEKIGFDVLRLQRVAIGDLKLGSLKKGEYRKLTIAELERVFMEKEAKPLVAPKRKVSKKRTPK